MGLIRIFMFFVLVYMALRFVRSLMHSFPDTQPRPHVPPSRPAASPVPESPYTILGIVPGASQREIRSAYQTLVQQYHPDKVSDMGPELRDLAEKRTKEITAAYNQLKRSS